ncbi:Sir2 family NAD-dependent protein deacetylase [Streptomyces sp. NPDC000151]|uniref:SIR2 family NAD-dependent protein deacylase n=1 Tax=Streptomyces sp. NPDC000151 TaxID=3154244 RepID=UPI00331E41DE
MSVAILSGAGISTDSGIPDYRGPNGVWRRDPDAEKLVTYAYYMNDPEIRRRSWLMRRDGPALRAKPNAAHEAVTRLERSGVPVRVITQNVDGLHQLAGMPDRKVLELHGTARTAVCTECRARTPMADALARVTAGDPDPACLDCGGIMKSATVMFGEILDPEVLGAAITVAKNCDVFLAVGTSLSVQPAASLAGLGRVFRIIPGPRRLAQHLAALSHHPRTPSPRATLRLAMHRTRRRDLVRADPKDTPWPPTTAPA